MLIIVSLLKLRFLAISIIYYQFYKVSTSNLYFRIRKNIKNFWKFFAFRFIFFKQNLQVKILRVAILTLFESAHIFSEQFYKKSNIFF